MRDLYSILGISRGADQGAIKRAYRAKAKEYHPDRNKNNPAVAEKFKEISAAYSILGDEDQRGRYDRGEIDEKGNAKAPGSGAGFGGQGGGFSGGYTRTGARNHWSDSFEFEETEDLMNEFWRFSGSRKRGSKSSSGSTDSRQSSSRRSSSSESGIKRRGLDITYETTVGFEEAITGGKRRINLSDGRTIDIKIPPGIQDGQVVRLSGQGGPGFGGAPKGDALVEVRVAPHPYFTRDGLDIHLELPIAVDEAVLGGDIEVPTPSGRLTVRIPKNSSSGQRLRLKGKGVKKGGNSGHIFVTLKVMMPKDRDLDLEQAIKAWSEGNGGDTGQKLRRKAGLD